MPMVPHPAGINGLTIPTESWQKFVDSVAAANNVKPETVLGVCIMVRAGGFPVVVANEEPAIANDLMLFHLQHADKTLNQFVEHELPN